MLAVSVLSIGIDTHAMDRFVSTSGSNISPYTNWTQAATSIQTAIDAASANDTIWVSNGVYNLGTTIRLNKRVTLRSVNGAAVTRVHGNDSVRCVIITNGATMNGFTITGGREVIGAGVYVATGLLENCVLKNNTAITNSLLNSGVGGGVSVQHGIVRNCLVVSNYARTGGGGVDIYSLGVVERSSILYNESASAAGVNMYGSDASCALRNCLVAHNTSSGDWGGVLAWGAGCVIQLSTITANSAGGSSGGFGAFYNPTITSSIVYGNLAPSGSNYVTYASATISYSCVAPLPSGTMNIDSTPRFVSSTDNNFRLLPSSPCIDAGGVAASVINDLDGSPRPVDGNMDGNTMADMGCYEYWSLVPLAIDTDSITIRWMGATNTKYRILTSADMFSSFSVLATNINGQTPITSYSAIITNETLFFTVGIEL